MAGATGGGSGERALMEAERFDRLAAVLGDACTRHRLTADATRVAAFRSAHRINSRAARHAPGGTAMPRSPLLVVGLFLVLLSLPSLAAPVAAQQDLPAPFLGRWQGTVVQGTSEYPAVLDLIGGPMGSVIGTIDYPNQGCGGDLTLAAVYLGGSRVDLSERLSYNASGCWQNGTVSLTVRSDGNLYFAWAHVDFVGQITGTLTRTGGTTGGSTTRCNWTGTWRSPVYGDVRLRQSGSTVSGDYDWVQGQISGTVLGDTLAGTWNEVPSSPPDPADSGEFVFTISADCRSFVGQWRYDSSGQWYTDWSADRVSN
jgi:hypothetical protein